jgi:MFS family permease
MNDTTEFGKNCDLMKSCPHGIEFENKYFESSALEFGWFCDGAYYASLYAQLKAIGILIGTPIFGTLADLFGRRPISIVCVVLGFVSVLFTG